MADAETISTINLVSRPLSWAGRQAEVDKKSTEAITRFKEKSVPKRIWTPDDLPVHEMIKLSDGTANILEGFCGVEGYLDYYVGFGREVTPKNSNYWSLLDQWELEEGRHFPGLWKTLVSSGNRTDDQMRAYQEKLLERQWSASQHEGVEDLLSTFVYTTFQERATYINYHKLRVLVRGEYGLPAERTPEEHRLGREIGASETIRRTALDEIAHNAIYLEILLVYLEFFPDLVLEKLVKVVPEFELPALRLVPNRRLFLSSMNKAAPKVYDAKIEQEQVLDPLNKRLAAEFVKVRAAQQETDELEDREN